VTKLVSKPKRLKIGIEAVKLRGGERPPNKKILSFAQPPDRDIIGGNKLVRLAAANSKTR
jgi:hypothetical protein